MNAAVPDYFSVLQLPVSCDIDLEELERNYRSLQSTWHPDRHAGGSPAEKLAAVQHTSLLNDAFTTLKSPLLRAEHLLQLRGVDVASPSQVQLDRDFLLEQLQAREELEILERGGATNELGELGKRIRLQQEHKWLEFRDAFAGSKLVQAQRIFYQLQFTQRLLEAARAAEDRLLGY